MIRLDQQGHEHKKNKTRSKTFPNNTKLIDIFNHNKGDQFFLYMRGHPMSLKHIQQTNSI